MIERYRKRGAVVRVENGCVVAVTESGEAIEENGLFRCAPLDAPPPALPDAAQLVAAARAIEQIVEAPLTIERLLLTDGVAEHEVVDVHWSERSTRLHLSLVNARHRARALVDLSELSLSEVTEVATALARLDGERDTPPRLRVAPRVAAVLAASLIDVPGVRIIQSAASHDGRGNRIEEEVITRARPFPNWYRPSFRVRPMRLPFHLRIEPFGEIDPEAPIAVALLAPVERLTMRVLCDDGARVFATTIRVERVLAAGPPRDWYPFGAGAFGAELML